MGRKILDFDRHVYEYLVRDPGLRIELLSWLRYGDTMQVVLDVRPWLEFVLRDDGVLGCYVLCLN